MVLEVTDLRVAYVVSGQPRDALRRVSFAVGRGETIAVVGESGSGKSTLVRAVLGVLPRNAVVGAGEIRLGGRDLLSLSEQEQDLRRGYLAYVPQDPLSNLDPLMRIGRQVYEGVLLQGGVTRRQAEDLAVKSLHDVGILEPERAVRFYPFELSGGMRQRVLIAASLAGRPRLLVADEPTSALDVTVQKRILDLLDELTGQHDISTVLVTHNLALAGERAHKILVLYQGEVVEFGAADQILTDPKHPYTKRLLAAVPRVGGVQAPLNNKPQHRVDKGDRDVVVEARNLHHSFAHRSLRHRGVRSLVLRDVSFTIRAGEVLGLVGESGSGKTTVARILLGLIKPQEGQVLFSGIDIATASPAELRQIRRGRQPVFQDPSGSFNPSFSVEQAVTEPLIIYGEGSRAERRARALELIDQVGLPTHFLSRKVPTLSGGQKQRLAIARALMLRPSVLICDEPVSSLDVIVQTQILDLLRRLKEQFQLGILFITHDLAVARQLSNSVAVMSKGELVEVGPTEEVFSHPRHPYTRELLDAAPKLPDERAHVGAAPGRWAAATSGRTAAGEYEPSEERMST